MRTYLSVKSARLMPSLPLAPPLTAQLQHKKATAAKLKSHGGASNSASSLGRLLAYDLPLPHDWIREVREAPDNGKKRGKD